MQNLSTCNCFSFIYQL